MKNNSFKIALNLSIYPLEAIKRASYAFTDIAFIEVKAMSQNNVQVIFTNKENVKISQTALKGKFLNELLHHCIRLNIAENNQKIREYIVTQALSSSTPFRTLRSKMIKPEKASKPVKQTKKSARKK